MRALVLLTAAACAAWSFQSSTSQTQTIRTAPVQPVRTVESSSGETTSRATLTRNMNGREVPVEASEERVISDSNGVRIVERVVRRYDANGNPGPPERTRIETRTEGGVVQTQTTVMRADINGTMKVAERSVAVTRQSGSGSDTTVAVERPTANAGFEVVERREETARDLGAGRTSTTAVTQRKDTNGRMVEMARKTAERTESAAGTNENAAEYEMGPTGQMRLVRQIVTATAVSPDGSTHRQVDTFEPSAPGQAQESGSRPQLAKRQVVERAVTPQGVIETISTAVAEAANPGKVGPLTKAEQTVCAGDCGKKK